MRDFGVLAGKKTALYENLAVRSDLPLFPYKQMGMKPQRTQRNTEGAGWQND